MNDDASDRRDRMIAIYDRFTYERRDRRTLHEMMLLSGGALATQALIARIATSSLSPR